MSHPPSDTNGVSITGPGGWGLVTRSFQTTVILVVAGVFAATVYFIHMQTEATSREHREMTQSVLELKTTLDRGQCISTLKDGEKQALRFNRNTPWSAWCWWIKDQ